MDASLDVRKFLSKRRDRAVGSILGYAEAEIRSKLTRDEWESLRRVVLDATNSYHDVMLDLVKSEDVARNDHFIALLESVDSNLRRQRREETLQQQSKDGIVRHQREMDEEWGKHPGQQVEVDFPA